ncbi:MAG TPA: hypothetical protein VMW76_00395, partial [Bacteroidales bacterium]|nr:hypothetical protein [Bacteroidales bacterium]
MKTVKFYFLGIILLTSFCSANGQIDKNFIENGKKAFAASTAADCQSFLKFCNEVLKVIPNHPLINYLAVRLNALLGNSDIALDQLKKAAKLGYTSSVRWYEMHQLNDHAFSELRDKKE